MNILEKSISVFFLIIAFCGGWYANGLRHEIKMQEYIIASIEKQTQDIQNARTKEQEYREKADKATKQAKEATATISAHYRKLLADGLPKSNTYTNSDKLSGNVQTSTGISRTNSCQWSKSHRAKFQRLYERQLEIAHERDAIATKYNALIKMIKGVQDGN